MTVRDDGPGAEVANVWRSNRPRIAAESDGLIRRADGQLIFAQSPTGISSCGTPPTSTREKQRTQPGLILWRPLLVSLLALSTFAHGKRLREI
jgi:hypothetical protein